MKILENSSSKYTVRRISKNDVTQVFNLCKQNTQFYKYCPPFITEKSILDDINALPNGKTLDDKYYVGFFDGSNLVAVLDLIDKYPDKDTVFIGFFMLDVSFQHKGIGTQIIQELCHSLKKQGYKHVRLGWVKGNNQSESFWHKNCFFETGASYNTNGYTVIVAQHNL